MTNIDVQNGKHAHAFVGLFKTGGREVSQDHVGKDRFIRTAFAMFMKDPAAERTYTTAVDENGEPWSQVIVQRGGQLFYAGEYLIEPPHGVQTATQAFSAGKHSIKKGDCFQLTARGVSPVGEWLFPWLRTAGCWSLMGVAGAYEFDPATNQLTTTLTSGGQTSRMSTATVVRSVAGVGPSDYQPVGSGQKICLLYTSPSPRDGLLSRMPSSA